MNSAADGGSDAVMPRDDGTSPRRVGVVAIGNVLHGDDGIGAYALRVVEARLELPADVVVADLGTPGPEFAHYLLEYDALLILDAVRTGAPAGTVALFRREEILDRPPPTRLSPHDPSLRDALLTADFAGGGPTDVLLVGVVPETCEKGTRLTATVRAAVPAMVAAVRDELVRLGVPVRERPGAADAGPTVFWDE